MTGNRLILREFSIFMHKMAVLSLFSFFIIWPWKSPGFFDFINPRRMKRIFGLFSENDLLSILSNYSFDPRILGVFSDPRRIKRIFGFFSKWHFYRFYHNFSFDPRILGGLLDPQRMKRIFGLFIKERPLSILSYFFIWP